VNVSQQTTTVLDQLETAMRDADWAAIAATYAPDVLLDMNLPTWRFQLQGRDAVAEYFTEQTGGLANLRTTQHHVFRTDDGIVIEEEMHFDGDDGEYLWRAVDIFHVDGDQVVEHVQYCTGCWPPDQVARQAAEAPMVRW
jgi:predicted SnoaL-like aldol condensation-catalyzing enzyme